MHCVSCKINSSFNNWFEWYYRCLKVRLRFRSLNNRHNRRFFLRLVQVGNLFWLYFDSEPFVVNARSLTHQVGKPTMSINQSPFFANHEFDPIVSFGAQEEFNRVEKEKSSKGAIRRFSSIDGKLRKWSRYCSRVPMSKARRLKSRRKWK